MKIFLNILLITLLFATSTVKADFPHQFFLGEWQGHGYSCSWGSPSVQDVSISHVGNEVHVKKVTGDGCVQSGHNTVRFNKQDGQRWKIGNAGGCTITLGSVFSPQSSSSTNCNVQIVNCNEFKVNNWNLTFKRKVPLDCPNDPFKEKETVTPVVPSGKWPNHFFLGDWQGHGYTCTSGSPSVQDVNITHVGNEVTVTKVSGDGCVQAGHTTVKFPMEEGQRWDPGNVGGCTIALGSVYSPQSSSSTNCNVEIINCNEFKVNNWDLTFKRKVPLDCPNEPFKDKEPVAPVDPTPEGWKRDYFLGYWIGDGYTCDTGKVEKENIIVTYEDNKVIAKKIKGDNCVNAGKITFEFTPIKDLWKKGSTGKYDIKCKITLGSPSAPQSSHSTNCSIEIVDKNNFVLLPWNLTFKRGRLPSPGLIYPHDYFLGLWVGKGYTCSSSIGFLEYDIDITYSEGSVVATKVTGDDCVPAGNITWTAILQNKWGYCEDSKSYLIPIRVFFGTPNKPSSSFSFSRLEILDEDTFKIPQWNLIFRRKGCWNIPEDFNEKYNN